MTNKLKEVIVQFKTTLKALSNFNYVGEYPADIEKAIVDGNQPAILIQEGDETFAEVQQTQSVTKMVRIPIWMYHNMIKTRIDTLTDRQNEIEDALLSSDVLEGAEVDCISWAGVEKGEALSNFDGLSVGYYENKSCRRIDFDVTFTVEREDND